MLANLRYLLAYAWRQCKPLFFTTAGKSLISALLPLVDIAGVGIVTDALVNSRPRSEVMRLIIVFIIVNVAAALLGQLLTLTDNIVMRKASDLTQREYMKDCVNINYHYAQDREILDLKQKSISANPVWMLNDLGGLTLYFTQFAAISYIIVTLSPLYTSSRFTWRRL